MSLRILSSFWLLFSLTLLIPATGSLSSKEKSEAGSFSSGSKGEGEPSQIQITKRNPVVNEGREIKLAVTDTKGNPLNGVTWTSSSPDIAQVDSTTGQVKGLQQGFATVTAQHGNQSVSVFVVVVRVKQGAGAKVPGDTKADQRGQVYISNPVQDVILMAGDVLNSSTSVFAGVKNNRGFRNGDPRQALFAGPTALGIDSSVKGGVYVADTLNHSLRKIGFNQEVATVLGIGTPGLTVFDSRGKARFEQVQFSSPRGVVAENGGNVFVADTDNHALYYVDFQKQEVQLVAGKPGEKGKQDGSGLEARFSRPSGLALSGDGRILAMADQDNNRVRLLELGRTPEGDVSCEVTTIGVASSARGVEVSAWRSFDRESDEAVFKHPQAVSFDSVGNINVVDESGVYVITRSMGQKPEVIELAQTEVTFNRAVSVTARGTETVVLDAAAANDDQALKVVTVGEPEITFISRQKVRIEGGEEVVLGGKNFAPESILTLGDSPVTDFTVDSATQIRFRVPPQQFHGDRTISVLTRGGLAQRKLTVIPKPLSELKVGEMTTVAGGEPYLGDGGLAKSSETLVTPQQITLDSAGNIYFADTSNHRIRRIDAVSGVITTVAGNGIPMLSGDGGPATSASLFFPSSVAVDSRGNLFIADRANHVIRRVDAATGKISTVAGAHQPGFDGDGGPALNAFLNGPSDVCLDAASNLYIADQANHRIRRVDAVTGIITTVAGNEIGGFTGDGIPARQSSLYGPNGVTVDRNGNLFIADTFNHRIRRVDAQTSLISTVAGNGVHTSIGGTFSGDGGPATEAGLNNPNYVALDSMGNVLIADTDNGRLRRVDGQTKIITTIAGKDGYGLGDGGPAVLAALNDITSVTVDGQGNVYLTDLFDHRIRRIDSQTKFIETIAGNGKDRLVSNGSLATSASITPREVALDHSDKLIIVEASHDGGYLYQVDPMMGGITLIAGNGKPGSSGDGGLGINAGFNLISGLAIDNQGNLIIADDNKIRRIDAQTQIITTIAGSGNSGYNGDGLPALETNLTIRNLTIDSKGNLFLSDALNNRIRRIDAQTQIVSTVAGDGTGKFSGDGGPALQAGLRPNGISLDSLNNLFIVESERLRLRRVDAQTGIITTVAGGCRAYLGADGCSYDDGIPATQAGLSFPESVCADRAGNLFLSDSTRVRKIDTQTGIITTVAGYPPNVNPNPGQSPRTYFYPTSLAIDSQGNLFIADYVGYVRVVKGVAAPSGNPPPKVTITSAAYGNHLLTVNGNGFGSMTKVMINGKDVSQLVTNQTATQISLKGSKQKLSLQKGSNQLVVTVNGVPSNTFVLIL